MKDSTSQTPSEWSEFSRKGGNSTKLKHGSDYYREIQKKSNAKIREKYGDDYFKELARKGTEARMRKKAEKLAKEQAEKQPVKEPEAPKKRNAFSIITDAFNPK